MLLIAPEGIEMNNAIKAYCLLMALLIAPEGIEIKNIDTCSHDGIHS